MNRHNFIVTILSLRKFFIITIASMIVNCGCGSTTKQYIDYNEKDKFRNIKLDIENSVFSVKYSPALSETSAGGAIKGILPGAIQGLDPWTWFVGGPIFSIPFSSFTYAHCSKVFKDIEYPEQKFNESAFKVKPDTIFYEILLKEISNTTGNEYNKNFDPSMILKINSIILWIDLELGSGTECAFITRLTVKWEMKISHESKPFIVSKSETSMIITDFASLIDQNSMVMHDVIKTMSEDISIDIVSRFDKRIKPIAK